MYKLTEKFLMLFPFYRERVRVMDDYAIRLSEAVEALRREKEENQAYQHRAAVLLKEINVERMTIRALMQIAIPAVAGAGAAHAEAHIEAFHGIPQPDVIALSLYPNVPCVHSAFVKAFNQSLSQRSNSAMVKTPSHQECCKNNSVNIS